MDRLLTMKDAVSFRMASLVLIILAIVIYIPSLGNGFVWDDGSNVAQKITLPGVAGLVRIWTDPFANQRYYPITHTAFWIDYSLWGLRPLPYHVNNILLLALTAVLIYAILRRLAVPGAWLAAAIFVVHPVTVETVAWVTERKNLLSGALFFGSALAYLLYARIGEKSADECAGRRASRTMYCASLGLFVCALLSKTATCPLPLVLVLILWWKRDRLRWREMRPLLPFFAAAIAMGAVTTLLEKHLGASGSVWNLTLIERTLVAGRALWFYAAKIFYPVGIMFIYPRWSVDPKAAWQYFYPVAAVAMLVTLWLLRKRTGKGPLVAVLYFMVMVGPTLGFLNIYFARFSFVQDHFQYLGSVGLITMGAFALAKGLDIARGPNTSARASVVVSVLVLVILGSASWREQPKYYDEESLWRASIASNPSAAIAHINLGVLLMDRDDMNEAGTELARAVQLAPRYTEGWCNYGRWLDLSGKPAKARDCYRKALDLRPSSISALTNIAAADLELGRLDLAEAEARRALKRNNRVPEAHTTLGVALARQGKTREAIVHFKAAVRLAPGNSAYQENLGKALYGDGLF